MPYLSVIFFSFFLCSESWKGQYNVGGGHETNPLLAALKSFLTAFVKFWSE